MAKSEPQSRDNTVELIRLSIPNLTNKQLAELANAVYEEALSRKRD